MRHRVLASSAVFGTLLLVGCGTSTVPGSAYSGAGSMAITSAWHVIKVKPPVTTTASGSRY